MRISSRSYLAQLRSFTLRSLTAVALSGCIPIGQAPSVAALPGDASRILYGGDGALPDAARANTGLIDLFTRSLGGAAAKVIP